MSLLSWLRYDVGDEGCHARAAMPCLPSSSSRYRRYSLCLPSSHGFYMLQPLIEGRQASDTPRRLHVVMPISFSAFAARHATPRRHICRRCYLCPRPLAPPFHAMPPRCCSLLYIMRRYYGCATSYAAGDISIIQAFEIVMESFASFTPFR